MKKLVVLSLVMGALFSSSVLADDDDRRSRYNNSSQYTDYNDSGRSTIVTRTDRAKVTDVEPIYRTIRSSAAPQQRCWTEPRYTSRRDKRSGSLVGAVIGSAIGYKLGNRRSNKRVGAVAGAIIGSSIGKDAAAGRQRNETYCEQVSNDYAREQLVGYNVTYKYKGKRYKTFMDYDPGRFIDIEISLRPIIR